MSKNLNPLQWISDAIDSILELMKTAGRVVSKLVGVSELIFRWPIMAPYFKQFAIIMNEARDAMNHIIQYPNEHLEKFKLEKKSILFTRRETNI